MKKKTYVTAKELKDFRKAICKTTDGMAALLARTREYYAKLESEGIIASFDAKATKDCLELSLQSDCYTAAQRSAVEAFISKLT